MLISNLDFCGEMQNMAAQIGQVRLIFVFDLKNHLKNITFKLAKYEKLNELAQCV